MNAFFAGVAGKVIGVVAAFFLMAGIVSISKTEPQQMRVSSTVPEKSRSETPVATSSPARIATSSPAISTNAPVHRVGWQVFSSAKYGFTFEYPPSWEFVSSEDTTDPQFNNIPVLSVRLAPSGDSQTEFDLQVQLRSPATNNVTPEYMKQVIGASRAYEDYQSVDGLASVKSSCEIDCVTVNFQKGTSFFNVDAIDINDSLLSEVMGTFQVMGTTATTGTPTPNPTIILGPQTLAKLQANINAMLAENAAQNAATSSQQPTIPNTINASTSGSSSSTPDLPTYFPRPQVYY